MECCLDILLSGFLSDEDLNPCRRSNKTVFRTVTVEKRSSTGVPFGSRGARVVETLRTTSLRRGSEGVLVPPTLDGWTRITTRRHETGRRSEGTGGKATAITGETSPSTTKGPVTTTTTGVRTQSSVGPCS